MLLKFIVFICVVQKVICTLFYEPRQVLQDEQEVFVKEVLVYNPLLINLGSLRSQIAAFMGLKQSVIRGEFPCRDARKYRSRSPPHSIHRLMPGDIDVIAALGDSLTAGMGGSAFTNVGSLLEDRGYSWSIGGQGTWRNTLTLPNILLQFNPNLIGFSTDTSQMWSPKSGFNVAEPGALGIQMPYMAQKLVERIKQDKRINFESDWKIVTFKIGHNDVCSEMCYLPRVEDIVTMMRIGLRGAIDYFSKHLPRTLVNVVPILPVYLLPDYGLFPLSCYPTNMVFCPCIFGPIFRKNKQRFEKISAALQNVFSEVVNEGLYDHRNDFAVVYQPFTYNLRLPTKFTSSGEITPDHSVFAPDCFHFSQKGYARAANALWNNMLEPEGLKSKDWAPVMKRFLCPSSQNPYIFTRRNSLYFNSTSLQ